MSGVQVDADFIKSPIFQRNLQKQIDSFKSQLENARMARGELKSHPAITLHDEGKLTIYFVSNEYLEICKLKSKLSSGKRQVIKALVGEAVLATLQESAKQKQEDKSYDKGTN